jgi:hypothetical protein
MLQSVSILPANGCYAHCPDKDLATNDSKARWQIIIARGVSLSFTELLAAQDFYRAILLCFHTNAVSGAV